MQNVKRAAAIAMIVLPFGVVRWTVAAESFWIDCASGRRVHDPGRLSARRL